MLFYIHVHLFMKHHDIYFFLTVANVLQRLLDASCITLSNYGSIKLLKQHHTKIYFYKGIKNVI